jgi:hypothetical protein
MDITQHTLVFGLLTLSLCIGEEEKYKGYTEEQVSKMKEADPMTKHKVANLPPRPYPSKPAPPKESPLCEISFNRTHTVILRSSLIVVPESLATRIGPAAEGSKYIEMNEFFIQNRGWISTFEVTNDQSIGKAPLSESASKMLKTSSNVIIATSKGNLVSFVKHQPN